MVAYRRLFGAFAGAVFASSGKGAPRSGGRGFFSAGRDIDAGCGSTRAIPHRQGARATERAGAERPGTARPKAWRAQCDNGCRVRGGLWRMPRTAAVFLLLAALGPGLVGADASAVTLGTGTPRPWTTPGTNPCRDLCGAEWALDRIRTVMPANIHAELARRLEAGDAAVPYQVTTGDLILAMSYAKAGTPYMDFSNRVAQFPPDVRYPARGYAVLQDGMLYRFVQVAACGNWALIVERMEAAVPTLGAGPLLLPGPGGALLGGGGIGRGGGGGIGGGIGGGGGGFGGGGIGGGGTGGGTGGGGTGGGNSGGGNGGGGIGSGTDVWTPEEAWPTPTPIPLPGALALLATAVVVLAAPGLAAAGVGRAEARG